jgi:DNA-binding MarR family transcriptional regulator
VTLNIDPDQRNSPDAEADPPSKPRRRRGRQPGPLVTEVLDELTAWNPREFIAAFQRWHQGQISLIQLNVLALLEATGPLPMHRLAEALDISVASLTGVVDRMEGRNLVQRRRDIEDRRVILVEPGDGGRRVFAEIDQRRRAGLASLLASLTDEELKGLLQGHRALRAARADLAKRFAVDKIDAMVARAKASRTDKIEAMLARAQANGAGKADRT